MSSVHLPCRCGAPRSEIDLGSGVCVACRRLEGTATSGEVAAALARLNRAEGGSSPAVRWQTPLAPNHLWFRRPPAKDKPVRVLVIPLDEEAE